MPDPSNIDDAWAELIEGETKTHASSGSLPAPPVVPPPPRVGGASSKLVPAFDPNLLEALRGAAEAGRRARGQDDARARLGLRAEPSLLDDELKPASDDGTPTLVFDKGKFGDDGVPVPRSEAKTVPLAWQDDEISRATKLPPLAWRDLEREPSAGESEQARVDEAIVGAGAAARGKAIESDGIAPSDAIAATRARAADPPGEDAAEAELSEDAAEARTSEALTSEALTSEAITVERAPGVTRRGGRVTDESVSPRNEGSTAISATRDREHVAPERNGPRFVRALPWALATISTAALVIVVLGSRGGNRQAVDTPAVAVASPAPEMPRAAAGEVVNAFGQRPEAASAEGGAVEAEGGVVEVEGGAVEVEGGAVEAEGGAVEAEGGAVEAEGGAVAAEGGAVEAEGGAVAAEGDVKTAAAAVVPAIEAGVPAAQTGGAGQAAANDLPPAIEGTSGDDPSADTGPTASANDIQPTPADVAAYDAALAEAERTGRQAALARLATAACTVRNATSAHSAFRKLVGKALRSQVIVACRKHGIEVTAHLTDPTAIDLARQAEASLAAGDAAQAFELAKRSNHIERTSRALVVMGLAACRLGDRAKAKALERHLSRNAWKQLVAGCKDAGIDLGR